MRTGQNPNRQIRAPYRISDIALTVVTHLPEGDDAYHAGRLEVVQTCLTTMRERCHQKHTMLVWDNGSGSALLDWLRDEFKPDILVQSPNIGKTAGRTALIRMLPPGTVFCYSDDDMYFYDNWLVPQLEILNHFPNVASVTGYPVRTAFRWGVEHTLAWAKKHGKLEAGRFIPREWENDFALSLGRDPVWHEKYTVDDIDYRVTYGGRQAYCTSHHCQFIGRAETLGRVLSWDNMAMGDERPFDVVLDELGLRLATTERLARHIGNVLDGSFRERVTA